MDIAPFRIDLAYTDQELLAYEAVVLRHQQSQADRHPSYSWAGIATGAVIAIIVAALAMLLGVARRNDGGVVAGLVFVGFYLGMWTPTFWAWVLSARTRQSRWTAFRTRWAGTTIRVTARGLRSRHPRSWVHYAWSAVERVSRDNDLIILWLEAEPPFAIPARLLTAEQIDFLLARPGQP